VEDRVGVFDKTGNRNHVIFVTSRWCRCHSDHGWYVVELFVVLVVVVMVTRNDWLLQEAVVDSLSVHLVMLL